MATTRSSTRPDDGPVHQRVRRVKVVALICARSGSKGITGKNLRSLGGRPLVAWAVQQALACRSVSRVLVSTDAEPIAAVAREAGAEVPFLRPPELAADDTPEWLVWRHALRSIEEREGEYPDALLVVPPTAPLRAVEDLERCISVYAEGGADVVITVTDPHRNPYFNMVSPNADGSMRLVIAPDVSIARRQDAPVVYDMTTVAYVARPEFVMARDRIFDGRVRHVHVPLERALDIDTQLDLQMAEYFLASRHAAHE